MKETRARELVKARSRGRCEVCGGRGSEYSHRRRRSVVEHRWSPANALWTCRTCHAMMHASPEEARENGWHVSVYRDPTEVPVLLFGGHYWLLDCAGDATEVMDSGLA